MRRGKKYINGEHGGDNYKSDLAIHLGEFLEEVLEEIGMNLIELATKINKPKKQIEEIINGQIEIDSGIASNLEDVLGIPAYIWTGLDDEYSSIKNQETHQ